MKKSLIIAVAVILMLVVLVLAVFPGLRQRITGLVTGERNFKVYSSKSGLISIGDENISFKYLDDDNYYLGGSKNYKHYEYFSLVGIPSNAKIISAKLTLYRVISGEELELRVRRVSEPWEEYQNYKMKDRYPNTFSGESIASGGDELVFDVTSMIQEMILPWEQGEGNYGFEFSKLKKSEPRYFYFKNSDEFKPKLEVVYNTRIKVS